MKVAEAISHALVAEGITLAAGIAGQNIGQVVDAVAGRQQISLMYVRQERVAVDICDGFARSSGNPAIIFADAGPAAANLMGGIVNSWGDSIPVLFFAGANDRTDIAAKKSKELPIEAIFGPVAKWTAMINDPSQVSEIIRRAFMNLRTGRGGPVVIGVPLDVSMMDVEEGWEYTPVATQPRARSGADPAVVAQAVDMIAAAERPYVYVGSGVLASEGSDELVELAELLSLPVSTTLNGKSAFPETHPLALGIGGFTRAFYGSLQATKIAEAADVILSVGCGFKRHAAWKRPTGKVTHIQVDVDPGELNRDHLADVTLLGDAKVVLAQMVAAARDRLDAERLKPISARTDQLVELRKEWDEVCAPLLTSDEVPLNPFRVTNELVKLVDPDETIVLHDAGTVRGSTCQHYLATKPRAFLGFGVESAMGWTIGAAMGASKANPQKLVVAVVGEEAFCETALDIETSIRNDAPILVIVKNNRRKIDRDGGASDRLAHTRFHQGISPHAVAEALGAKAYLVDQPGDISKTLEAAISEVKRGHSAVVEFMTTRPTVTLHSLWDK